MASGVMENAAVVPILSDSDLSLAERHRHGDPDAFREVYDRFEGVVYNLALRLAGRPEDAEDLAQEVFLRIFRKLGSFRGRSSLKTWVFRVALNCCRSGLRRRWRWAGRRLETEGVLEAVPDPRRGPEERALGRDAGARVAGALARLPVEFREAVVLRDLQGLSYEEIAELMRVRLGTVRSRIARGRERLRAELEAEEWPVDTQP
jgi:RNA polymerase sigma-70 factor, ECF subfamily